MAQVTKSDYETAQVGDAKVRQDFLESVDLEEASEFVKKVSYDPSSKPVVNNSFFAMCCHSPGYIFFNFALNIGKSDISVYPESFTFSYPQFINSLIKHEGQHARQAKYHPYFYPKRYSLACIAREQGDIPLYDYLESLVEISALANELIDSDKIKLADNEKYNIAIKMSIGLANLHSYSERDLKKDFRKIMCDTHGDYFAEKLIFEKDPSIFLLGV